MNVHIFEIGFLLSNILYFLDYPKHSLSTRTQFVFFYSQNVGQYYYLHNISC